MHREKEGEKRNVKWLPKSGKLTNGYKRANKPKIKKKKHTEEARTVCVQWDKGWIHIIHVHDAA